MKTLVTLALALFAFTGVSQNYYWVGGSGNWSDFATHWATSSGGSTFHTSAPTSTDNVFFDVNSFTGGGQVVTLDVVADCNSMDWTGVSDFPTFVGNGNDLNIYGSLTLAADMTANLDDVEFESTSTGNTITSNGTSLGSNSVTRFLGIGGEWTLQDNFQTDNLFINAGTFNTGNNDINSGAFFQTSGSDAKVLNLGASVITSERWWIFGTNQTINAGTSKIVTQLFYGDSNGDGPFTYYDVEFNNGGILRNSSTFNEITVVDENLRLEAGQVFTINNLVADGSKHALIEIYSETGGSEATFSKAGGSVNVSFVELEDVHVTGGATFTANNSIDNGNTTGWTINALMGQDYYWVGDGGDWTDFANHWATTSGGSTMHTDYPDKLDDVYFDANSFTMADQVVNNDLSFGMRFHDMDWTGVTNNPEMQAAFANPVSTYGSITFTDGMIKDVWNLDFYGEETGRTFTFAPGGSGVVLNLGFWDEGGYTIMDDITLSSLTLVGGNLTLNDITVNLTFDFGISNNDNKSITLGNSTVNCRNWETDFATFAVNEGTSTINVSGDFEGGDDLYFRVVMDGNGAITGSNTFHHLEGSPGSTVNLEDGTTQTILTSLTLDGTKSSPITLNSTVTGNQATISKLSGTIDATYLILQDMVATGGATFNATETIDNGNNTGWNITSPTGADYFWVGDGGNWSDFANHWATTSGGSTMHTEVPGILDNAIFDANSFSTTGQTVTVDQDVNFHDMTWTDVTNMPTLGGTSDLNIYGSLTLDAGMIVSSGLGDYNFLSDDPETITAGPNVPGTNAHFHFIGTGSWSVLTDLTVRELDHHAGDVNFNGNDIHVDFSVGFFGTDTKTMTLGASTFFTRSLSIGTAENLTLDATGSSITTSSSFDFLEFSGTNSYTFNNLKFIKYNEFDIGRLTTNMTLNTLEFDPGTEIELRDGITVTINNLIANGTFDDHIQIFTLNTGNSATISQASGTINAFYLELSDIIATGGATFNAFSSIDNGGVAGWIFNRSSQTITFPSISDKVLGDPDFELAATATSGLPVSYSVISGNVTITGSTVSIDGAGDVQIQATQAGNIDYDPAPSVINSFNIAKLDQTITFDAIPVQLIDDGTYTLTATGGPSTSPVTYTSSNTSVATVSGDVVTFVSEGTTTITASQAADEDYNAAPDVMQDLTISSGEQDQTITFDALSAVTYGDASFDLTATASSGLEVSYVSSDETVASISGSTVTIVGVGTTTITASQAGDAVFNPAPTVDQDLLVNAASLTVTADDQTKIYGDANPTLTATYSGFVNGEDETALNTEPTVDTNASAVTEVGDHAITLIGGSADNYTLILVEGTLTITKRDLTAVADDGFMREGDLVPELTISYDGLVNADQGSDIDIPPAIATTASSASPVGKYPITVAGGEDNNYLITMHVEGTMTVDEALAVDEVLEGVHIYPNPVSEFLTIEVAEAGYSLELRSAAGKLISSHGLDRDTTIDLRDKEDGLYLLILRKDDVIKGIRRLIVE